MSFNPKNYLSKIALSRKPSAIRALAPLMNLPGMISLGGGNPNASLFPFKGLSFKNVEGKEISLTQKELDEALQYSPTPGLPCLLNQLKQILSSEHKKPLKDPQPHPWSVMVTTGSQDGLTKAFEALIDSGDNVLIEKPTYSGALAFLNPLRPNLVEIETDEFGIVPSKLEKACELLPRKLGQRGKPKVLYTIPTGQNPSGSTLSIERRHALLALAQKYDFIILEDDPYYWLYYGKEAYQPNKKLNYENLPSLFSLDQEGRVLRFDSFSKVLSSGLRLGFVSGHPGLIDAIGLSMQATSLHSSGLSQMMVSKWLEDQGSEGWKQHTDKVRSFYQQRRDTFCRLADKHLKGLAEWSIPSAGMFVWFKINGISNTRALIEEKARQAKFLMVPGQAFNGNDDESCYVRAAFSQASEEQMDEALARFATLLKSELKSKL